MLTKYLWVFFVSMVPLVELRGSIIISQGLQLPVLSSYIVAIIGNMLAGAGDLSVCTEKFWYGERINR